MVGKISVAFHLLVNMACGVKLMLTVKTRLGCYLVLRNNMNKRATSKFQIQTSMTSILTIMYGYTNTNGKIKTCAKTL